MVPALAEYTIDIRTNEYYNNLQVIDFLKEKLSSEVKQRSSWLNSSYIDPEHPVVTKGKELNLTTFGSSTLSDQALMDFPTIKIGPGVSARSHTADEFIKLSEIKEGIDTYINLLSDLKI